MKGYHTYYKTAPYDLIECKRIRVFKWLKYPRITINNLDDVLNIAYNDPDVTFWESERENFNKNTPFEFPDLNKDNPMIFNTVVYLSMYGESLGFTSFSILQDTSDIEKLNIYLDFDYEVEEFSVILENSLKEHIEQTFTKNLDIHGTKGSFLYTTKRLVSNKFIDSYPRYSNDVHHYIDDNTVSILNSYSYISHNIVSKIKLNEINIDYKDNINVGIYRDDIVVYEWNKSNYKITSLIRKNSKGDPYQYFLERPGYTGDTSEIGDVYISYVSSEYVICNENETGDENVIFNARTGVKYSKDKYSKFISNHYDDTFRYVVNNNPDLMNIPEKISNPKLLRYTNSVFNIDKLVGNIVGFEGSFLILENGDDKVYANLEGAIKVKSSNNTMVINDCCILEQTGDKFNFYFTDNGSIVASYDYIVYDDQKNPILETNEKFRHLMISSPVNIKYHQVFDGFRKNPITYEYIPRIICSFGGLLFYEDKNKLKYL